MFNWDLGGGIRYDSEEYIKKILNRDGGKGSGNFGHSGRKGKVGGSGKGGGKEKHLKTKSVSTPKESTKNTKSQSSSLSAVNENSIIKSIDIDDLKAVAYGKDIRSDVIDHIYTHMSALEEKGHFVYSELFIGRISPTIITNPDGTFVERTPVLQTAMLSNGLLQLSINTDAVAGKSVAEIDKLFSDAKNTVCNSFEEGMIHESAHAKMIKGKAPKEVEQLYKELESQGVKGISKIAAEDGAEAIPEIEVLLSRGEEVSSEGKALYKRYMK